MLLVQQQVTGCANGPYILLQLLFLWHTPVLPFLYKKSDAMLFFTFCYGRSFTYSRFCC